MTREAVLILDFGSQYTQLIARRVREQRVYCEIHPCALPFEQIRAMNPRAIVLSGGPASVSAAHRPRASRARPRWSREDCPQTGFLRRQTAIDMDPPSLLSR